MLGIMVSAGIYQVKLHEVANIWSREYYPVQSNKN